MNANALTLLAVLAGSAALAQEYHPAGPIGSMPLPAVIQPGQPCHTPAPPPRSDGRWELRTTQQYVPGATTQVYVAGQCYGHGFRRVCEQGRYVTQQLPGHYETRQEWTFVAYGTYQNGYAYQERFGYRHSDRYGRGERYGRGHGRR